MIVPDNTCWWGQRGKLAPEGRKGFMEKTGTPRGLKVIEVKKNFLIKLT